VPSAADGEHTRARRLAVEASGGAAALGQHASAMRAAHELCRLGGAAEAAPRLAELAGRADGEFAPLAAAHTEALAAGDGSALMSVADAFAALDALLLAAEAASAAALALRDEGRADSDRAASARSLAWLGRCEGRARRQWSRRR
jgi:hypothetical protein